MTRPIVSKVVHPSKMFWGIGFIMACSSFFAPRFNKMSDEDKKRFIEAVTGAGGKIDSKAAAALIAAAASGGDPEIANKVEKINNSEKFVRERKKPISDY